MEASHTNEFELAAALIWRDYLAFKAKAVEYVSACRPGFLGDVQKGQYRAIKRGLNISDPVKPVVMPKRWRLCSTEEATLMDTNRAMDEIPTGCSLKRRKCVVAKTGKENKAPGGSSTSLAPSAPCPPLVPPALCGPHSPRAVPEAPL